jgi:sugar phosphate isomerase/epimerase
MNRRQFIKTAALATAATATLKLTAEGVSGVHWPIGCFNRPWKDIKCDFDTTLAGTKEAGYKITGLLTAAGADSFVRSNSTPEYLEALKKKIAAAGLRASMASMGVKESAPEAEAIKDVRQQIDNTKFLDIEFLLTFGAERPQNYENYYAVMRDAAAYAQERGVKLVMKPHGGGSGAAEEIMRCLDKVKHPNFKIWYDAGNIIYYTGKDPLEQLKPIAEFVTGFCAKDCDRQKGNVWLEFGKGNVDFHAVFGELKRAGFNGPVMVECCEHGKTAAEMTANVAKNRVFLEKVFRDV